MKIVLIVPRVVQRFTSQLPEVTNNAYPYFNYDHRVVNERVDRGDVASNYKGSDQFSDKDYDSLIHYAMTRLDPELQKYSPVVAAEDALNKAIRSFGNGTFDGKVNANKFAVLLKNLMAGGNVMMAGKKKKEPEPPKEEPKKLTPKLLKEVGITRPITVPTRPAPERGRPSSL